MFLEAKNSCYSRGTSSSFYRSNARYFDFCEIYELFYEYERVTKTISAGFLKFSLVITNVDSMDDCRREIRTTVYIGLATERLRILSLGGIRKIRDRLVANSINSTTAVERRCVVTGAGEHLLVLFSFVTCLHIWLADTFVKHS